MRYDTASEISYETFLKSNCMCYTAKTLNK